MRARVICLLALLGPCVAHADTIHLKNGRTIQADHVRQDGGHVEYEIGDDTYRIPLDLVDKIDTSAAPAVSVTHSSSSSEAAAALSSLPPLDAEPPREAANLSSFIVHDGHVDDDALRSIEAQGDRHMAALSYALAGTFARQHGDFEHASQYLLHGLSLAPDTATLEARYADLLITRQRTSEAITHAERAVRLEPNSADYQALLGFAYFMGDRSKDAVVAWRRSLDLRPNDTVRQYLAKAERELAAESNFGQQESSHFTLHYEGHESEPALRHDLLAALENDYDDLVRQLGVAPRESIPVVLYTNQAFFDVTQAPSWADAVYDGKLRIPLDHVQAFTPELARVLKHELAHCFINQLTHGRAPQWLHEGVAQMLEPRSVSPVGTRLARLFSSGNYLPFNMLEAPFSKLEAGPAAAAYAESLAAAEYIRATYGMSDLQRILQRIGDGSGTEAALRTTIHTGYAGLQQDLGAYLQKTYGP